MTNRLLIRVNLFRIEDMNPPRSHSEYHSRAESFIGLTDLARTLGRPLDPMLRRHGFPANVLTDPEAIISYNALCKLLEACANEWDCPDFGLRLARLQNLNILGPVGLIARLSDTVGDALKALRDSMIIHSNGFTTSLDEGNIKTGVPASITYSPKPGSDAGRQMIELAVGISMNILAMTSGMQTFKPVRVGFQHSEPLDTAPAKRFFGAPVQFNELSNSLYFDPAILGLPTAIRDTAYAPLIRAYFDQLKPQMEDDIVSVTRRLIEKMLSTGRCSRDFIADCLHLHPRTFQRRLGDQGVTFNQLLDDHRRSLALDLISRGNAPLTQVADTLGYADQSSFHQAFRRWTKTTPRKFRHSGAMA